MTDTPTCRKCGCKLLPNEMRVCASCYARSGLDAALRDDRTALTTAEQLVIAAARRWRSVEAGGDVARLCDELCDAVDALDAAALADRESRKNSRTPIDRIANNLKALGKLHRD